MIVCETPRCCECARPMHAVEPFLDGAWQQVRCVGCGVYVQFKRLAKQGPASWVIRTAAEGKGHRTAPLPPVAPAALKAQFFDACRAVARFLQPCEGVEPGMANLEAARDD